MTANARHRIILAESVTTWTEATMCDSARKNARRRSTAIILGFLALSIGACERNDSTRPPSPTATAAIPSEPNVYRPRLAFPESLRVDDESVSAFVERALVDIAGGDYELYRLLWSVKDEPSPRNDYEQRWHGVTDIELRALRRIILTNGTGTPGDDPSYAFLADFTFDPADPPAQREPLRDVVWVVVKEQENWCLTKPPKAVKRWLREQVAALDKHPKVRTESAP